MKTFIGPRLRRLRKEHGQTQGQMAKVLGISTSYVNLLEKNERSVSVPVLLKLMEGYGVDWQDIAEDDDTAQLADIRAALQDPIFDGGRPDLPQLRAALAHSPDGVFDLEALVAAARGYAGLEGLDLAKDVTCAQSYRWDEMRWAWPEGYTRQTDPVHKVVAIDYGAKRNILRCLASAGCDVTVLPATATAEDVLALTPDGVFLSNGPGDPAATGTYAVPMIEAVLEKDIPVFGICLGHQMLALALGAKTIKMNHGHHGANHPVKDFDTGKVEITSMNHGFTVDAQSLPDGVVETHVSLFDGSNCGIRLEGRDVFSVQYHPEASPGPMDSYYLFERFAAAMARRKG